MDVFLDAQFVRLRCCVRSRKYLTADDDGWSVVLSEQRDTHNTVWAVEAHLPCDAAATSTSTTTTPDQDGAAATSASASPAQPAEDNAEEKTASPSPEAAGSSSDSPECSPSPDPSPDTEEEGGYEEEDSDTEMPFFLLRGAYGRYLLTTERQASTGPSHGVYAVQNRDHSHHPTPPGMLWQALPRRNSFIIRNATGRYLRGNGKYFRWRNTVTVAGDDESSMLRWFVEDVPIRIDRPTLLDPPAQLIPRDHLPATQREVSRTIRYVRADGSGNFRDEDWKTVKVRSNSLLHLRVVLANLMGHNSDALHTTICVRAGDRAELSPLLIDLPIGNDPIDVVVLSHRTPVENALLYPDVYAIEDTKDETPKLTKKEIIARYFSFCTRFNFTSGHDD